jgi:hypothetical protein
MSGSMNNEKWRKNRVKWFNGVYVMEWMVSPMGNGNGRLHGLAIDISDVMWREFNVQQVDGGDLDSNE